MIGVTGMENVIDVPDDDQVLFIGAAYEYCMANWCIANESGSLFDNTDDKSFAEVSGCDRPYDSEIENRIQERNDQSVLASMCCDTPP